MRVESSIHGPMYFGRSDNAKLLFGVLRWGVDHSDETGFDAETAERVGRCLERAGSLGFVEDPAGAYVVNEFTWVPEGTQVELCLGPSELLHAISVYCNSTDRITHERAELVELATVVHNARLEWSLHGGATEQVS